MPLSSLLIIFVAALLHASWNLLAKQAASALHFVFLYTLAGAIGYLPFVLLFYSNELLSLSPTQACFLAASAVTHLAYALMLQHSYRQGDLSVVYPLARGTGPLIATLGGIVLFGERPSLLALCGAGLVISGVFFLAGGRSVFSGGAARGAHLGVLTGFFIAGYTLVDARAVSAFAVVPLIIDFTNNVFRSTVLLPRALGRWEEVRADWLHFKWQILGVAALGPMSYLLVLHVLKTTPVSYVAPAREMSMLLAAVLGAVILGEENLRGRFVAAALIAAGVGALALG